MIGVIEKRHGRAAGRTLFLLLLLGAGLLYAGCGGDDGVAAVAEEKVAVTPPRPILRWMGPAFVRPVDRELVARCGKEVGIAIELLPAPANPVDRLGLYLQFLPAESDDIDLIDFDVVWSGTLAPHLLDLNPHLTAAERGQYFPIYLENNSVGEALVGLPQMGDVGLLYYRTDLLEKYGFEGPPDTWSELEEMAAAIQAGERGDNAEFWGYVWQGNVYEGLTVNALEWQASMGGGLIVDAEGRLALDDVAAGALDRAAAWVGEISPEAVTVFQEEDARWQFQNGNAAFMRNWPYAYGLGQAEDSPIRDRFGVTRMPKGDGAEARHASVVGGQQIGVSRYSRYKDAAADAARCLTDARAQRRRALADGTPPGIAVLYEDGDVKARIPAAAQIAESLAEHAVARPAAMTGGHYTEISLVYFVEVNRVLTGEQDGASAVARVGEQVAAWVE
ncbi:MAG: ABC transporter substrate-binding protein [Caldilineaceae bacterium]|nr:ABC transporter substrate-binding protein [Caldilineaceae bacterium]